MADSFGRSMAAEPGQPPFEFVRAEFAPLQDGGIRVAVTATFFDERDFELVDQELASDRVPSIDAALALVRERVVFA